MPSLVAIFLGAIGVTLLLGFILLPIYTMRASSPRRKTDT